MITLAGLNGLGSWTPTNPTIPPGTTSVVWTWSVDKGWLIGGLFDIGISVYSGPGYVDYCIRTVECPTSGQGSDPTTYNSPVAPVTQGGTNPRGSWPHDSLHMCNSNHPWGAGAWDLAFADAIYGCDQGISPRPTVGKGVRLPRTIPASSG